MTATARPRYVNPLGVYYSAGLDAGRAMTRQDGGLYAHLMWWKTQAMRLETPEARVEAEQQWTDGYRIGRGPINR